MSSMNIIGEDDIPVPPMELMRTVGPVDDRFYRNPDRVNIFDYEHSGIDYDGVFDFGCGCGRIARQMMLQAQAPSRYLGIDLNAAAIAWCQANLAPHRPGMAFRHIDIYNRGLNPAGSPAAVAFPAFDGGASLVIAHSVFTHILERDLAFYVGQCARALRPEGGLFRSTWFLFDKRLFPMMQDFQNGLYINLDDPTNAVVYDFAFVRATFAAAGLKMVRIIPPEVRGFQWVIYASRGGPGEAVDFPDDVAPLGRMVPPQ
ncbi:methyltransferase family protein [Stella humosa]|uniref:Methyltransferase family protein n=2 Tax=Stella humosa TaxID=94 RepID=A0A3N1MBG5_9PROT|nr:methyltransferase family protein [Stella humosa]